MKHGVHIYALRDPRDGEVRYIGRSVSPRVRLSTHCTCVSAAPAVRAWVLELTALGLRPELEVLRSVAGSEAAEAERDEIAIAVLSGAPLLNTRHVPPMRTLVGGTVDPESAFVRARKQMRERNIAAAARRRAA